MTAKAANKRALKLAREIRALGDKPFSAQNALKFSARQRELLELCLGALEAGLRFTDMEGI